MDYNLGIFLYMGKGSISNCEKEMSKKLEKILDKKYTRFVEGINNLINDIKVLKKDESHKIILLKKRI